VGSALSVGAVRPVAPGSPPAMCRCMMNDQARRRPRGRRPWQGPMASAMRRCTRINQRRRRPGGRRPGQLEWSRWTAADSFHSAQHQCYDTQRKKLSGSCQLILQGLCRFCCCSCCCWPCCGCRSCRCFCCTTFEGFSSHHHGGCCCCCSPISCHTSSGQQLCVVARLPAGSPPQEAVGGR